MSRIALLAGAGMLGLMLAPGTPALAQTAGSPQSTSGSTEMHPGMGSSTLDRSPSGAAGMNSPSPSGTARMGSPETGSRIQPPPVAQPRGREAMGSMQPARPVGETQQQRRQLDNVANALNQCQMQPDEQRSQCMRRAMESRL